MNELIKITYNNDRPAVSARDLHDFLEVGARYNDWFPRMCEYGFTDGDDFNLLKIERVQNEGGRMVTRTVDDAVLTIDMAKELCMIQRNEKGKHARQYFLQIEKDWNSPEKVMARALQIAADIAPVLGRKPYSISIAAKDHPEQLGFPVSRIGTITVIPRLSFLKFLGYEVEA